MMVFATDSRYCSRTKQHLQNALLLVLFFACVLPSTVRAQDALAIVGGKLIDGRGGTPIQDAAVVINGSIISAAGPASTTPIPVNSRIINATGKSILPGLIDAHMHIGASGGGSVDPREFTQTAVENSLLSYLKFGVTTVYDMAANPDLQELKSALNTGELVGPRIYGNGFGITAPGSHPVRLLTEIGLIDALGPFYFQVDSVVDARNAVDKIAAANTDGVKIFHSRAEGATFRYDSDRDKLMPEVLRAVIVQAHSLGLKVYAHISFPSEARDVVEAGGDVIVHSISTAEAGADAVFNLMAAQGVAYIPTLTLSEWNYALNEDGSFTSDLRGKVWDVLIDSVTHPESVVKARQRVPGLMNDIQRSFEISMSNLRRAVEAEVTIAMGSDGGNAGTLHGASAIRELELMILAGMTPMQVIVAATRSGAEVIGVGESLGTVEPGKLADIVVVDGDPIQDISNMRNVAFVVKNGDLIDISALAFIEIPGACQ